MKLDDVFYARLAAIQWFSRCGESLRPDFGFPVQWVDGRFAALQSMFSTQWADATTIAQGRLTEYLAKTDYDTYGTTWNKLITQSQARINESIIGRLSAALDVGDWPATLAQTSLPDITLAVRASIGKQMAELRAVKAWDQCLLTKMLVNINRAAMEATYRRKFPKAPVFFEHILRVYESGRLPCGWDGELDQWPEGKLLVY